MTVKDLIDHLNQSYKPDTVIAYTLWETLDVIGEAGSRGIEISKEQAERVLEEFQRTMNHEVAAWSAISTITDEVLDPQENNYET